jgi:AsmA family protein
MTGSVAFLLNGIAALLVALAILGGAVLPRHDLAGLAAREAGQRLGREIRVGSLHVRPGLETIVTLRDARLANIEGGSAPDMLRLAALDARIALRPLLRGEVELLDIQVQGLHLLLERTPDGRRNWRFRGDPAGPPAPFTPEPPDRSGLPLLHALNVADSEIVFRTSSGRLLRTRLDQARLGADAPDQPLRLAIEGRWNEFAVAMTGRLGSAEQLRAGRTPFPMALAATSGDARLAFDGVSGDPLSFDRLDGRLHLRAARLGTVVALAGAEAPIAVPVELAGAFIRRDLLWRLTAAEGALDGAALTMPLLALEEGRPDRVAVEAATARLDLRRLLPEGPGGDEPFDLPMRDLHRPDPMLRARLSAGEVRHGAWQAREAALDLTMEQGGTRLDRLSLGLFGGQLVALAEVEAGAETGTLTAEARLDGAELEPLRVALALDPLPLRGRVEGRAGLRGSGATLREAVREAEAVVVLGMRQGSVERAVIEQASTDIQALFRRAEGFVPLTCLLGVVQIRAGQGTAAPLRLRATTGTVRAAVGFDLRRRLLEAVIRTRRETTGPLALDLPVRVTGSFDDPSFDLARLTPREEAWLAAAPARTLPAALRDFAAGNPCHRG